MSHLAELEPEDPLTRLTNNIEDPKFKLSQGATGDDGDGVNAGSGGDDDDNSDNNDNGDNSNISQ